MRIRNFIHNRIPSVRDRISGGSIRTNPDWKPIIEVQVQHNILEGTHKIKLIPIEKNYAETRKQKGLKL